MEEKKVDEENKDNKENKEEEDKENKEDKENIDNKDNKEEEKENNDDTTNYKKEEKINNESIQEKERNQEIELNENNTTNKENINLGPNDEKGKRHRRGKNEISERRFKCPDCEKSYLSAPALMMHRKTKHNYTTESERKLRGRPKKENQENTVNIIQNKFNDFFNIDTRKKFISEENNNDNINIDIIKDNLNKIFKHGKSDELFSNIDNIEDYTFYKLMINNWNKQKPEIGSESYCDNYKLISISNSERCNTPPLDDVFFLYLKEFSEKTNKDYFWFINKFIVLLREFINDVKKENIKDEYKTEDKKEYTQLFGAEDVPENCNDFFLEFMEPKKFFGLNNNELIELTQHFCFWLYLKKYSHSYLTLI